MDMQTILQDRVKELGISRYEVSKRVARGRGSNKATDVSSVVNKILEAPEGRRYSNIAEVVKALGGDIVIRWHSVDEKIAS